MWTKNKKKEVEIYRIEKMKFGTQKHIGRQETVAYGDSIIFNAFCLPPLSSPLVLFLYF